MESANYETTLLRAAVALLCGAVIGSALIVVGVLSPGLFWSHEVAGGIVLAALYVPFVAVVAFVFYAVGLLVLGAPGWFLLHRQRRRNWVHAIGWGFVASFLACSLLQLWPTCGSYGWLSTGGPFLVNDLIRMNGWLITLWNTAWVTVAGGVVGLAIWRIAYRVPELGATDPVTADPPL
jgi:hypothetical protein